MVALDTTAPTSILIEQATRPANEHFIYKQYEDGKKKSRVRLPDRRKSFLWLVSLVCVICVILAIAASVNPVPVFSSTKGLLAVTALYPNTSLSISKDVSRQTPNDDVRPRDKRDSEYNGLELRGERQYWNKACACYKPKYPLQDDEFDVTTYTTTTATGLIMVTPTSSQIIGPLPKPKPTKPTKPAVESEGLKVDPGAFAGLFLGLTGACLQRRSGVLVCTSTSFSPKYSEIYEIAGLTRNVTAQLPTGTGGASVGLLISIITYLFTTLAFVISALPRAWFYGPRGHKALGASGKLPDLRHQWTLILATGLAAISTFIVVAASVQLQNAFGASAEAVEAWDKTDTLEAKLLDAYAYLYACAILSGLAVVASLAMIAYDFQHPWWLPTVKQENTRLQAISSGAGFGTGLGRGRPHANSWSTTREGNEMDNETIIVERGI